MTVIMGRWRDQSAIGIPFRHDFKLFGTYSLPYPGTNYYERWNTGRYRPPEALPV